MFASGLDIPGIGQAAFAVGLGVSQVAGVFLEATQQRPGALSCPLVFGREGAGLFEQGFAVALAATLPPSRL